MLDFGLNQVTMANAPIDEFIETASRLGMVGVELRNDLGGPVFDEQPADRIRRSLRDRGLRLLGVSQVYPFNRWSNGSADDVHALIDLAVEVEADTISLIPCNDGTGLDVASRQNELARALERCLPLLEAANMVALVEPLGFARSSLRDKADLVAAIEALGAHSHFRLVHDTFHHTLSGGGSVYPEHTGIVHVSGVTDADVPVRQMEDEHRVLVDAHDRLGNLDQIFALRDAGYQGAYSFECFSPDIHRHHSVEDAIRTSMNFISSQLQKEIAA